jgi:hypothetical protein
MMRPASSPTTAVPPCGKELPRRRRSRLRRVACEERGGPGDVLRSRLHSPTTARPFLAGGGDWRRSSAALQPEAGSRSAQNCHGFWLELSRGGQEGGREVIFFVLVLEVAGAKGVSWHCVGGPNLIEPLTIMQSCGPEAGGCGAKILQRILSAFPY